MTDTSAEDILAEGHRGPLSWARAHGITRHHASLALAWAYVAFICARTARKPSPRRVWSAAGTVCNTIALHYPRDGRDSLGPAA